MRGYIPDKKPQQREEKRGGDPLFKVGFFCHASILFTGITLSS